MYYATLCAIAKDEDNDLVEWVDYHLRLGFEHIYIYDNASKNSIATLLHQYCAHRLVTVVDYPENTKPQLCAYAASIAQFGAQTTWMAYIDIDEFIVSEEHADIRDALDTYRAYGGLALHWKVFGSNGHKKRPEGGILHTYTQRLRDDTHIKSIVQPKHVAATRSPHHFLYRDGFFCVNEDAIPVATHQSYHTSKTLWINHYYYKSFEDFLQKMERGLATPAADGRATRDETELTAFSRQALAQGVEERTASCIRSRQTALPVESLAELAHRLHQTGKTDFPTFAATVSRCVQQNTLDEAFTHIAHYRRYHDTPELWALAARVCLLAEKAPEAHAYIARLVQNLECPLREQGYAMLAQYYILAGDPKTAKALQESLAK